MRLRPVFQLVLAMLVLCSSASHAQIVQGQLVDRDSGSPIERAFVVLLDVMGVEADRALTDGEGRFRIPAPGAGTYRLRTERIGFKATLSDEFVLVADQAHEMEMRIEPVAIRLDVIEIEGDAKKCRLEQDQGLETATVWEEARKVLASVAWGESKQAFTYEIKRYELYYEQTGRPNYDNARIIRQTSVMPFNTPGAEQLQEEGYVLEGGVDSAVFYAPDAQVFFSDAFLEHHCFKLKRDKDYPGLVGLEFKPTGGSKPDVKGIMWLDDASGELRFLEIGYDRLRSHTRERYAEARIEFANLPNGQWFVKRWYIKMPMVEIRIPEISGARFREEVLHGYIEEGREVLKVMTVTGKMLWEAPAGTGGGP